MQGKIPVMTKIPATKRTKMDIGMTKRLLRSLPRIMTRMPTTMTRDTSTTWRKKNTMTIKMMIRRATRTIALIYSFRP